MHCNTLSLSLKLVKSERMNRLVKQTKTKLHEILSWTVNRYGRYSKTLHTYSHYDVILK